MENTLLNILFLIIAIWIIGMVISYPSVIKYLQKSYEEKHGYIVSSGDFGPWPFIFIALWPFIIRHILKKNKK